MLSLGIMCWLKDLKHLTWYSKSFSHSTFNISKKNMYTMIIVIITTFYWRHLKSITKTTKKSAKLLLPKGEVQELTNFSPDVSWRTASHKEEEKYTEMQFQCWAIKEMLRIEILVYFCIRCLDRTGMSKNKKSGVAAGGGGMKSASSEDQLEWK